MKVLLTKDVAKVGKRGEVKELSSGFVRNMLLPKGLAVLATPEHLAKLKQEQAGQEKKKEVRKNLFLTQKEKIVEEGVVFTRKANKEGHLFAGILAGEIAEAIHQTYNLPVHKEHIQLTHPIKSAGVHMIPFLYEGETAHLKVVVTGIS